MGTARDWMSVVFWGIFWAASMLLRETLTRRDKRIKPILSPEGVLGSAFFGLFMGLAMTFHWRAFRWPLILFTALTFAGGVFIWRSDSRGSAG